MTGSGGRANEADWEVCPKCGNMDGGCPFCGHGYILTDLGLLYPGGKPVYWCPECLTLKPRKR